MNAALGEDGSGARVIPAADLRFLRIMLGLQVALGLLWDGAGRDLGGAFPRENAEIDGRGLLAGTKAGQALEEGRHLVGGARHAGLDR